MNKEELEKYDLKFVKITWNEAHNRMNLTKDVAFYIRCKLHEDCILLDPSDTNVTSHRTTTIAIRKLEIIDPEEGWKESIREAASLNRQYIETRNPGAYSRILESLLEFEKEEEYVYKRKSLLNWRK